MARYALVVGISEYQSKYLQPLRTPVGDADAIANVLRNNGGCEQVKVLKGKVTKKALETALITLLTQQAARNEVLIYFTGHGLSVKSGLGSTKGYLATTESRLSMENGQLTDEPTKAIAFSDLNDLLFSSNLSNLVLLLDACHSGEFIQRELIERGFSVFNTKQDHFLIAACRAHEEAWIKKTAEHSVFTDAVLNALTLENADSDYCITGDRLFDSLRRDLKGSRQEPVRFGKGRALPIVQFSKTESSKYSGLNYQVQNLNRGRTLWDGRYTIRGPLSSGGFGVTYRAVDNRTKRTVVIKTPNHLLITEREYRKFVRRFKREGEALNKVSHPNIVEIIEYFEEESVPFLVMAFIEGDTLQTCIEEQGNLTEFQAASIFRKLAEALDYLHALGMIHGDVHFRNIMISLEQEPILIDLGGANSLKYAPASATIPINLFFSPYEKINYDIAPRPTIDIYGLSAALYFSVTGQMPPPSIQRKIDVIDRKSDGSVLPLLQQYCPNLGNGLSQAILEGMALEPEDRPSSIRVWMSLLSTVNIDDATSTRARPTTVLILPSQSKISSRRTLQVEHLSPGQLLHNGRYTIENMIGTGGFSRAYLALDHVLNKSVVVKTPRQLILRDEQYDKGIGRRLKREYRVLSEVKHPNLIEVLDFFFDRETPCLVLAYEEGETLYSYVRREGRISPAQSIDSFIQLAKGLSALHNAGWIHCDVHPGNIIVRQDDSLIISDLGSSKSLSPSATTLTTTINQSFTPYEQGRQDNKPLPSLDIYAIAATFYFAITGETPVPSINRKLYGTDLKFPKGCRRNLSGRLSRAILKGMALEPGDRPRSMYEWIQLL